MKLGYQFGAEECVSICEFDRGKSRIVMQTVILIWKPIRGSESTYVVVAGSHSPQLEVVVLCNIVSFCILASKYEVESR